MLAFNLPPPPPHPFPISEQLSYSSMAMIGPSWEVVCNYISKNKVECDAVALVMLIPNWFKTSINIFIIYTTKCFSCYYIYFSFEMLDEKAIFRRF